MKRLLLPAAVVALAIGSYSCTDTPATPTSPSPTAPDISAFNPPPPPAGSVIPLDLRSRLHLRSPKRRSDEIPISVVQPASFAATLSPGQTAEDALTVNLPAAPPKGDVLFLFDLTGSMGPALVNLKANAVDVMSAVQDVIPDVQFGLVSHEDYPAAYTTSTESGQACNYAAVYGIASLGDQPYRRDQSITGSPTAVVDAITAMTIKGGSDGPEAYSRALYETYADEAIGWRTGAKRVVVSFGDNVPHDCNFDFKHVMAPDQPGTGNDPGRDGVIGTPDDLGIEAVLNGMKANGITLVSIVNNAGSINTLWNSYASVTGGLSFAATNNGVFPSGTTASTIASLISSAVRKVNVLTLEVCAADARSYGGWLTSVSPASYADVTLGESKPFTATVAPPTGQDLQNGSYTFHLCAMGDGVEYGRQEVVITADGSTTYVPSTTTQTTTVTVLEGGKPVAGVQIPAGTFGEDVQVKVAFKPLVGSARCHDYLLAQYGRCLEITALKAGGQKAALSKDVVAGLCLPTEMPLELFKFETRTGTPIALKQTEAPFLDCSGFQVGALPRNWFEGLALGLVKRVGDMLTPSSLYAAHSGFGGVVSFVDGLSTFTWASPLQVANAGMVVNLLRSGKDAYAVQGTFNWQAKGFDPFATETRFDPAVHAVTVGFGNGVYLIPANAFKYSAPFKRWVYAAKVSTGITSMEINPLDGSYIVAATVPTEGTVPSGRPFSLQIGHRTQGAYLLCEATAVCKAQEH